jgi:uncharacterized membrane protein
MDDVKPNVVGHWGTAPGQNFIYLHLNRIIKKYNLDMIYISGPGHGGQAMVSNTYLEGSYTEIYPNITEDEAGLQKLFKQFSFPGGVSSHVAPEVPGSINEGGELGYSLSHAYGAVMDNPNLIVACCIGSLFIVLNERKGNNEADSQNNSEELAKEGEKKEEDPKKYGGFSFGTILGLILAFIDIFFVSVVDLANKVLANNRVSIHTQCFYVGINTIGYSLIYLLFTNQWYITGGYAIFIFFQALLFYVGNFFFNAGLKYIDLAKTAPLTYTRIAFVLILGFLLLCEKVYFSDIVGTCLIIGYMVYNLYYPIVPEKK